jgi:hypothetical protein
MPIESSIDPAQRLITIRYTDPYTFQEWSASLTSVLSDARFRPGYSFLIDRRDVEAPSAEFVREIDRFKRARRVAFGPVQFAIVVNSDVGYGMARVEQMLNEVVGLSSRVFRSIEAADEWLAERSRQ